MSVSFEDAEWRAAERAEEETVLRKANRHNRDIERRREAARRWTLFWMVVLLTGIVLLLTGKAQSGEALPGKAASLADKPTAERAVLEPLHTIENCRVTYYCPCALCCGKWADGVTATGAAPQEGVTVAVDPTVIPLGSTVYLDGRAYTAQDTGVSGAAVDVYVADHQRALRLGIRRADVSWKEAGV